MKVAIYQRPEVSQYFEKDSPKTIKVIETNKQAKKQQKKT